MKDPRASGSMNDTGGGSKKWGSTELDDEVDDFSEKIRLAKKIHLNQTHCDSLERKGTNQSL